jgi:hypothetical protein
MLRRFRQEDSSTLFFAIVVVLGALRAWGGRLAMNNDGISYLDVADAYLRHDWSHVVNGCWSPLYPGVLALSMWIAKPSARWEFPLVHAANLVIFVCAAAAFAIFIRNFKRSTSNQEVHSVEFTAFCYASFFFGTVYLIGLAYVTPDLLVAAVVFTSATVMMKVQEQPTLKAYLALGICLGVGYWTKAVMLPLGCFALGVIFFNTPRRLWRWWAAAVLAFCFVVLPWVYLLSRARGRLTTGDAGRIAYGWMVNPRIDYFWDGAPLGSGTPIHPVRRILAQPTIYEFDGPVIGTYPPWYDAAYWQEGARIVISTRPQLSAMRRNLLSYVRFSRDAPGIIGALVVLLAFCGGSLRELCRYWIFVAITLGAFCLNALILVEARYIGAFVVVLVVVLFGSIQVPSAHGVAFRAVVLTAALATTLPLVVTGLSFLPATPGGNEFLEVAAAVHRLGVEPGTKVAVAGDGARAYWARLGRFRIVAEIREGRLTKDEQQRVHPVLCRLGIGALVADFRPADTAGWQRAGGSHYVYPMPGCGGAPQVRPAQ